MAKGAYIGVLDKIVRFDGEMYHSSGGEWKSDSSAFAEKGESLFTAHIDFDGVLYKDVAVEPFRTATATMYYAYIPNTGIEVGFSSYRECWMTDYNSELDTSRTYSLKIYTGNIEPVARKVKKGYIGVPTLSASLGSLEVGSTIKLNVSGAAKDFIVVQQGTPSNLYDASCNGTWLLMKDIYTKMGWGIMRNVYADSNIHSNLNGTFLGALDAHVQSAIKQVKIPYVNGVGNGGTVASGSNGLSTKVFLLSGYELGWTGSDFPKDGACLAYFNGASAYDDRYKLKYNGTATGWWMRSPYPYDNTSAFCVDANGSWNGYNVGGSYGVRPAFVLPSNLSISNGTIDGTEAGTKDVARKIKKAYIGIDGVARLCWEAQPDIVTFTVYQNKTDAFTFTMPSGMTFDEAISAGYANGYNANGDTMILMNDNANGYLMRQIRYVAGQLRGSGSVYTDTSRATRAYITDTPIEGNFYDSSGGVVAS